jgi:hypothetical protein
VELSNFHGFVVVDFKQQKEITRITLPEVPVEERNKGQLNSLPLTASALHLTASGYLCAAV